ncbi:MAG: lipid-A-disaccharide synthase [Agarilytica sp.]
MKKLSRVAIVVGEASGDMLGAGLMEALQRRYPDCQFEGIGGAKMIERGFVSHFAMDRLAVMGFVEPLKRLPELLGIRKSLRQRYTQSPPDIFIGIDAPDFNLSLEGSLKKHGVKTVHYVSPSVWAWRQGRVKTIAKAVDLMLTLFPFEERFYQEHKVKVHCVGHPLADKLSLEDVKVEIRQKMNLVQDAEYLALLPGSRHSEVALLSEVFLSAAEKCVSARPGMKILMPAANEARLAELTSKLSLFPSLDVTLSLGNSHEVMAAADVVLMASGTTTLEAMLLKRPMVIAYKMGVVSYWILKRLVKSKYVGLPNLLANRLLVPELLQENATVENISRSLMTYFESEQESAAIVEEFQSIHRSLKKNANEEAANAIEQLYLN